MIRRFPALLLSLAFVLAACGGESGGEPGASGPGATDPTSGPSTATTPDGPTTGTAAPRVDGKDGVGGGSISEADTPVAGTYRYSTTVDLGEDGQFSGGRTISYYEPDGVSLLVRQTTQVTGSPPREWWFRFDWRERGLRRVTDFNPSSGLCTLDPPLMELRFPVKVGQAFTSTSTCPEQEKRWTLEVEVPRTETVTVDGQRIETLVIKRALTRAAPGADPDPLLETYWYSPEHRLILRMRTRGGGTPLDLTDSLISLQPEKLPTSTPPDGV